MEITEMKSKSELNYIKKEIEKQSEKKIDKIECFYNPIGCEYIIKGLTKERKYFAFLSFAKNEDLRDVIQEVSNKLKEVS